MLRHLQGDKKLWFHNPMDLSNSNTKMAISLYHISTKKIADKFSQAIVSCICQHKNSNKNDAVKHHRFIFASGQKKAIFIFGP